jgi:hypothetical protein
MIVNDFRLAKTVTSLYDFQEFDDCFAARTDDDLALTAPFCIVNRLQNIGQYRSADHSRTADQYRLLFPMNERQ